MIGAGNDLAARVENLDEGIVVVLVDLDQVRVAGLEENVRESGRGSEGFEGAIDEHRSAERMGARDAGRKPWRRPPGEHDR